MTVLGYTGVGFGVLLLGVLIGYFARRAIVEADRRRPNGPTVAELLYRLVHSSRNGIVVFNRFGDVLFSNARAEELGVIRDNRPDVRASKAVEQVTSTNAEAGADPTTVDLSPMERRGRAPSAVLAEIRSLGDGFVLLDAVDETAARRLEATRRDFVANVSHELKTPVGAIALLAEAARDAVTDPDEVRRFTEKIAHESNRLGNLVTELIALSRLEGAEPLPELSTVHVDELVDEALTRSRVAAESAGIEVVVDESSELLLDGDRTLLITALSNLVDNAIAYSPSSGSVSISRRRSGDSVEIAVTDRGIGIDPEDQERVFERFFRVDKARSRATGGTGLGLAIVKHVAANHGGEVRLWSSPGTGSTFTLRIPRHHIGGGNAARGDREPADSEEDNDEIAAGGQRREAAPSGRALVPALHPGGAR